MTHWSSPIEGSYPILAAMHWLMGCGVWCLITTCIPTLAPIGEASHHAHRHWQPNLAQRLVRNKALFTLPQLSLGSLVNI